LFLQEKALLQEFFSQLLSESLQGGKLKKQEESFALLQIICTFAQDET